MGNWASTELQGANLGHEWFRPNAIKVLTRLGENPGLSFSSACGLGFISDFKEPMLIGWSRGKRTNLEYSAKAGFRGVHIGIQTSKIHLSSQLKKDENWILDTACEMVEFYRQKGMTLISVSAIDMSRTRIDFLKSYAKALEGAGATRLRRDCFAEV